MGKKKDFIYGILSVTAVWGILILITNSIY